MKQKLINGRWNIWTTDAIAEWDGLTGDPVAKRGWEYARFESLHRHTFRGFTLFEVGAEHGAMSAVIGREFVGPGSMVLFEPSPELWVNIRKHWVHNGLAEPLACFHGFVGEESTPNVQVSKPGYWPFWADATAKEIPAMAYRSLASPGDLPTITLDDYVAATGILPNGFNIDVEGAELMVLRGARELLSADAIFGTVGHVWVSIHPDLLEGFGHSKEEVLDLMAGYGWCGEHLATDHEEHWHFTRCF